MEAQDWMTGSQFLTSTHTVASSLTPSVAPAQVRAYFARNSDFGLRSYIDLDRIAAIGELQKTMKKQPFFLCVTILIASITKSGGSGCLLTGNSRTISGTNKLRSSSKICFESRSQVSEWSSEMVTREI